MVLAKELSDLVAAVCLIAGHPIGSEPGAAFANPFHGAGFHQILKGYGLMSLTGGENESYELSAPLGSEMDFGGESSLAVAKSLRLRVPFFSPAAC